MQSYELEKILTELEKPSEYFEYIKSHGLFNDEFQELFSLAEVPQNPKYHAEGSVWVHTMLVLDSATVRRNKVKNVYGFMLSALCHDFGKAVCTETINGVIHAYNHENEGLPLVRNFLSRLSVDSATAEYVLNMVRLHMKPNKLAAAKARTKSTNRLFDSAAEPYDLIQLAVCDGLGKIPQDTGSEEFLLMRLERYNNIMARPYVTAEDLINAGISERLDKVLEYAHKLRLAGADKAETLRHCEAYARKVLKI